MGAAVTLIVAWVLLIVGFLMKLPVDRH